MEDSYYIICCLYIYIFIITILSLLFYYYYVHICLICCIYIYIYMHITLYVYIGLSHLLELHTMGGMGWDVNVHVNLQKQLIERGPQSCARLAAPVTRQKPELVSHVSGRGLQTPCSC